MFTPDLKLENYLVTYHHIVLFIWYYFEHF